MVNKIYIYFLIVLFLICLTTVPTDADESNLDFQLKHNRYEDPINLWHFQIVTPTKKYNYPRSLLQYSDMSFLDSTISFIYGNRIYIRKKD